MTAYATWKFEVDWNADGAFGNANSDITAYVISASWSYGRDYASQLRGRSSTGSCSLSLFNTSGIFSSFNAASPIYRKILPGLKVRITATYVATPYVMFLGYLDSINPIPALGGPQRASLTAHGPFGRIAGIMVTGSMQTDIWTGTAMTVLLAAAGWDTGASWYTGDAGKTNMVRWWTGGQVSAMSAMREIEDTETGFIRESKEGKIVYEDRHHRMIAPHTVSQATYSDAVGAALSYKGIAQSDPLQQIYNEITGTVRIYSIGSLAVLWTLSENGANSPLIQPGITRTFWASAAAVNAWTTPVASTDYFAFANSDGSGINYTTSFAVVATKFDSSMKIAITNNGTMPAYVTLLQARGTPIIANDPITMKTSNLLSMILYGQRTYPLPGKWISNTIEAQSSCDFLLGVYSAPIPVLTLSIIASRSAAQQLEALTREISDRITITANGAANLGINEDFFVERITHNLQGGEHISSLECSPASASACWNLGTSALNTDTKLAY